MPLSKAATALSSSSRQETSFDNRFVRGAPFSADIVTETIQTLPDGNRIVPGAQGRLYRDSQGRTRNERTFLMGGTSEQKQTINISDPVGGLNYNLDPETRTARKINSYMRVAPPMPPPPPTSVPPGSGDERRDFQEAHCLRRSVAGQGYQGS